MFIGAFLAISDPPYFQRVCTRGLPLSDWDQTGIFCFKWCCYINFGVRPGESQKFSVTPPPNNAHQHKFTHFLATNTSNCGELQITYRLLNSLPWSCSMTWQAPNRHGWADARVTSLPHYVIMSVTTDTGASINQSNQSEFPNVVRIADASKTSIRNTHCVVLWLLKILPSSCFEIIC